MGTSLLLPSVSDSTVPAIVIAGSSSLSNLRNPKLQQALA